MCIKKNPRRLLKSSQSIYSLKIHLIKKKMKTQSKFNHNQKKLNWTRHVILQISAKKIIDEERVKKANNDLDEFITSLKNFMANQLLNSLKADHAEDPAPKITGYHGSLKDEATEDYFN